MNVRAVRDRFQEIVALRSSERAVQVLPPATHESLVRDLAIVYRKRDAARLLWPRRGMRREAADLLRAASGLARAAMGRFGSECPERPRWLAGAESNAVRASEHAKRLPEDFSSAEADDAFWAAHDELLALERAVGVFAHPPSDFRRLRRRRALRAAAVVALLLLATKWVRSWDRTKIVASATFAHDVPTLAMDHDVRTNWGLPDGKLGWIELQFKKPRLVKTLHVVPYNPPFHDRNAKDVHVTAYLAGDVVKELDFTFPDAPKSSDVNWTDVPLDASYCDRVRIEVKSFAGKAGSFAEIQPRGK